MKSKITRFWSTNYKGMTCYVRARIKNLTYKDEEDIVQDVMLSLLNKNAFLSPISNFTGYVYQSLRNRLIDEIRKAVKEPISLNGSLSDETSDEFISLLSSIEECEQNTGEIIHTALDLLPDNQRYVIIENELKGRKLKDIALESGISLNTLLSRKARGMKNLKKIIITMEEDNEDIQL